MNSISEKRRLTIIQGHPDRNARHLGHALAEAYASAASEAGHDVRIIEIAQLDFPLLRSQTEFEKGSVPEAVRSAQDAIAWSDHILIIFPLWLGTMPAILKGFLEQVFRPSFAFQYGQRGFPKKLLAGRSARIVVTMGMPAFVYRWFFLAHGLRGLERNILRFVGFHPIRDNLFGAVDSADEAARKKWLATMAKHGRRGN